jgi:hypothetical protein
MKIIACSLLVFGAAENRHIAAAIVIEIINNPVPLPLAVLVNDDLPLGGADAWVLIPIAATFWLGVLFPGGRGENGPISA